MSDNYDELGEAFEQSEYEIVELKEELERKKRVNRELTDELISVNKELRLMKSVLVLYDAIKDAKTHLSH